MYLKALMSVSILAGTTVAAVAEDEPSNQTLPLWRMLEPKEGRRRPRSQVSETSMIAPKLVAPLAQFSQRYVTVVRRDLASWARRPSSAGKGSAQVALTVKRPHM